MKLLLLLLLNDTLKHDDHMATMASFYRWKSRILTTSKRYHGHDEKPPDEWKAIEYFIKQIGH